MTADERQITASAGAHKECDMKPAYAYLTDDDREYVIATKSTWRS